MTYKKRILLGMAIILGAIVLYSSVYFEKLDKRRSKELSSRLSPEDLVKNYWATQLRQDLARAIEISLFDSLLTADKSHLIDTYGKSIGFTSRYCFLVKGKLRVDRIQPDRLLFNEDKIKKYHLRTKYIFGNTVREALGYFNVDDFESTMVFNAISSALINEITREVLPVAAKIKTGEYLQFAAQNEGAAAACRLYHHTQGRQAHTFCQGRRADER